MDKATGVTQRVRDLANGAALRSQAHDLRHIDDATRTPKPLSVCSCIAQTCSHTFDYQATLQLRYGSEGR